MCSSNREHTVLPLFLVFLWFATGELIESIGRLVASEIESLKSFDRESVTSSQSSWAFCFVWTASETAGTGFTPLSSTIWLKRIEITVQLNIVESLIKNLRCILRTCCVIEKFCMLERKNTTVNESTCSELSKITDYSGNQTFSLTSTTASLGAQEWKGYSLDHKPCSGNKRNYIVFGKKKEPFHIFQPACPFLSSGSLSESPYSPSEASRTSPPCAPTCHFAVQTWVLEQVVLSTVIPSPWLLSKRLLDQSVLLSILLLDILPGNFENKTVYRAVI